MKIEKTCLPLSITIKGGQQNKLAVSNAPAANGWLQRNAGSSELLELSYYPQYGNSLQTTHSRAQKLQP